MSGTAELHQFRGRGQACEDCGKVYGDLVHVQAAGSGNYDNWAARLLRRGEESLISTHEHWSCDTGCHVDVDLLQSLLREAFIIGAIHGLCEGASNPGGPTALYSSYEREAKRRFNRGGRVERGHPDYD